MSKPRAPSPSPASATPAAPDAAGARTAPWSVTDPGGDARTVPSDTLLGGAAELRIDHGGVIYRLRVTALGKLILTK